MKPWACLGLCALLGCSNYAHVAETKATFRQSGPTLMLLMSRHMDTVMSGPDIDEDQHLVLELARYEIGKRIPVPSPQAKVSFDVERFGPSSEGSEFVGYVIVKKVLAQEVTVTLHLDVTAHTANGQFVEQAKFRGEQIFYRNSDDD